jgi:hypothetical protein
MLVCIYQGQFSLMANCMLLFLGLPLEVVWGYLYLMTKESQSQILWMLFILKFLIEFIFSCFIVILFFNIPNDGCLLLKLNGDTKKIQYEYCMHLCQCYSRNLCSIIIFIIIYYLRIPIFGGPSIKFHQRTLTLWITCTQSDLTLFWPTPRFVDCKLTCFIPHLNLFCVKQLLIIPFLECPEPQILRLLQERTLVLLEFV